MSVSSEERKKQALAGEAGGGGSMRVIWAFAVDADFPLLQGSSSGTEGTTVFEGGGRLGTREKGEGLMAGVRCLEGRMGCGV